MLTLTAVEIAVAMYYVNPSDHAVRITVVHLGLIFLGLAAVVLLLNRNVTSPAAASPAQVPTGEPSNDITGSVASVLAAIRAWGAATSAPSAPSPPPAASTEVELSGFGRALTVVLIVIAVVLVRRQYPDDDKWWLTAAVATAFALYIIVLAVARSSGESYWGTGVAVFVSVGVFGAALSTLRYSETRQVQPIAALRAGEGSAVCGIFVAEADNRLYLARLDRDRRIPGPTVDGATGHLFWLDRKSVVGWTLGALQSQSDAEEALKRLEKRVNAERWTVITHTHTETRTAGQAGIQHSAKKTSNVLPPTDGKEGPPCSIYAV